ncbi:peptidoglycan-binding protein LysM [Aquimarina sp. ERC-38]|uniref:peptidoglycan-binding protein LysM n=1 Tax=Aquimarina sp. ERC-38 TaxID=2949996 RepID=UPI002245C07C|nr:peptidoglycan-binding protein LysM [Aquimarina sp. ERC-38]UZO79350.1 peptidoglycan-binding protein LysM [Aquimarina sp. ERC-38]
MKKKLIGISVILTTAGIIATGFTTKKQPNYSSYSTAGLDLYYLAPNFNEVDDSETNTFVTPVLGKTFDGFKEALAFKESRGSYKVINQFGYMGKYQFSKGTLALVGIKSTREFMANPELQEKAFYAYVSRNKWVLRKYIEKYSGKMMNGIKVTESGILAAAHLAGPGAVKDYLKSGGVAGFEDAYGTTIRYYMKRFGGYDTSIIVPNRKAKAKVKIISKEIV